VLGATAIRRILSRTPTPPTLARSASIGTFSEATMATGLRRARARASWGVVACAVVIGCAVKLLLARTTDGTLDVAYWALFLDAYQHFGGLALYRQTQLFDDRFNEVFNHPPFMIHVLRIMGALATATRIPFPFWLRLPAILADVGTVALVGGLLGRTRAARAVAVALAVLAVAPPAILVSGFHGNTDPVMVFFILLTVYLLTREQEAGGRHHTWLAGAAFGMGMNIKVVPLLLLPVLLFALPTARKRLAFLAAAGAVVAVGSLPYLLQDPVTIAARIFGYGSQYGRWGVPRVLGLLPPQFAWLDAFYARAGRYLVLASVVAASWAMNRRATKPPLALQCGLILFLFLFLTPGFGVQYLAWLVPWPLEIGLWAAVLYYTTSGLFLLLVYTFAYHLRVGGFPWGLADAAGSFWRGQLIAAELACWIAVGIITLAYCQRLRPRRQGTP